MKTKNKTRRYISIILLVCSIQYLGAVNTEQADSLNWDQIYIDLKTELYTTAQYFQYQERALLIQLEEVNSDLRTYRKHKKKYREALETKLDLLNHLDQLNQQMALETMKIRYRRGVDLIKLLYEKILGLDHHFTGMQTFQNVLMLSNPHSYPEFREIKEIIERKKNKRYYMGLPSLLESNPFISATHLLVSSFLGESRQNEKELNFEKISCILDFTVRKNADLNVIRHETEFLRQGNKTLKEDCERMFAEYAKVIGYLVPLSKCRNNDDWETLYDALERYGNFPVANNNNQNFNQNNNFNQNQQQNYGRNKDMVNLEFATQRVSDFITKYSSFINRGTQYYQKFDNIISSYENENHCREQLPRQFVELKFDIKSTIEKFNNTYNLPEIQGSRLKDLLFGEGMN